MCPYTCMYEHIILYLFDKNLFSLKGTNLFCMTESIRFIMLCKPVGGSVVVDSLLIVTQSVCGVLC